MPGATEPAPELSELQREIASREQGMLLVVGVAGSGRTEALAARLARLAEAGEGAIALTGSRTSARELRARAERRVGGPFEEIVALSHREAATRLLREHSAEAGLNPFLEQLSAAERLAMLLDRLDELPLRRHEIRGNAAGLLARLIARIDALKAAGVEVAQFRGWSDKLTAEADDGPSRDSAEREREFADLFEIHDAILQNAGAIDEGSALLELTRLLGERPGLADAVAARFPQLLVDELEDACPAERALIERLARGARGVVLSCDDD